MATENIHPEGEGGGTPSQGSGGASRLDDGGPAFPEVYTDWSVKGDGRELHDTYSAGGMSLRDWFAAKAMASLIIDPERADQSREECARLSYLMADAMLKARKTGV